MGLISMGNGTHFSFLITYFSFLHMPDSMLSISAADSPSTSTTPQPSTSTAAQQKPSTSTAAQKKKKTKTSTSTAAQQKPSTSTAAQKKKKKKKSKASRACVDVDDQEIRMNGKENVISLSFLIKSIKFLNGAIS